FYMKDGLYAVRSLPSNGFPNTDNGAAVTGNEPSVGVGTIVEPSIDVGAAVEPSFDVGTTVQPVAPADKGKKRKSKTIVLGQHDGVTDEESNRIRDITIDSMPQDYLNTDVDSRYLGLLYYLLRSRSLRQPPLPKKPEASACAPQDVYVNYVYEHDIHNQVFNSSFQDPNSVVIQSLQSDIARHTAEELYKRNLVFYVTDEAHLIRVMDVSSQYNDRAALRFYVSINVSKNLIPIIRHVLETVFAKLQNERFATSNKKVDWGEMVLIPITK
ncbi:unnamed protein product, partial [Rotaria sp. Silwood2]